jgi:hypothetical protein
VPFWISIVVLALVAFILWRYTRSRNLMDVAQDDFVQPKAVRDKFLIALAAVSVFTLCRYSYSANGEFISPVAATPYRAYD